MVRPSEAFRVGGVLHPQPPVIPIAKDVGPVKAYHIASPSPDQPSYFPNFLGPLSLWGPWNCPDPPPLTAPLPITAYSDHGDTQTTERNAPGCGVGIMIKGTDLYLKVTAVALSSQVFICLAAVKRGEVTLDKNIS